VDHPAARVITLLGLDPGFASLGYAILAVERQPRVLLFGAFETAKTAKKHKVLAVEDNVWRAMKIAKMLRYLATCAPRTVALCCEAMSFPRNASVAAKMAMSWGCIASLSEAAAIPVLQASPQRVKEAVCGVKTATKEEVQSACLRLYPEIGAMREATARTAWEHPHDALACAHLMLESDVVKMIRLSGGAAA
jgi:Holliday junction resolvasome RuvABC endonuclease subunit